MHTKLILSIKLYLKHDLCPVILPGELASLQFLLVLPGDVVHAPEDNNGEESLGESPVPAEGFVSNLGILHTPTDFEALRRCNPSLRANSSLSWSWRSCSRTRRAQRAAPAPSKSQTSHQGRHGL